MGTKKKSEARGPTPEGYVRLRGEDKVPHGKGECMVSFDSGVSWYPSDGSCGGLRVDQYAPTTHFAISTKCKAPKARTKHVWTTRTLEITDRVPKTTLRALILEGLDEINQLGTENAKLKNQIASRKQKGVK